MAEARQQVVDIHPEMVPQLVLEKVRMLTHPALPKLSIDQFVYEPEGNYLYVPDPEEDGRRVALFHATTGTQDTISLESREERLDPERHHWREVARGPGLYGGNTVPAAASSMVDKNNIRNMGLFLTDPIPEEHIVDDRHDKEYFWPMIRAQFDPNYARNMVRERAHNDHDRNVHVRILSPGLVSLAKTDTYMPGITPEDDFIPRSWIRVVSRPLGECRSELYRIGDVSNVSKENLPIAWSKKNAARFAYAAMKRVAGGLRASLHR